MEVIHAILFDCNGVIADDEPIHLELFQKVLKEEGIRLTRKEYFQKYLAMDDRSCFKEALKANGREYTDSVVRNLIRRKAAYYKQAIKTRLRIFPGVQEFVKKHAKVYALAVVSGALRAEINMILKRAKIVRSFSVIVSAENVKNGKPHPESYIRAWKELRRKAEFRKAPLHASECVAIEDSIHGIDAAHKAGMKCIAVTNSYSKRNLRHADLTVASLEGLEIQKTRLCHQ